MGFRSSKSKKNTSLSISKSCHGRGSSYNQSKTKLSPSVSNGSRTKSTSLSKSLHGKIGFRSKKRNHAEATTYSYAVVSQSTEEGEDFVDNRLQWDDPVRALDTPQVDGSPCTKPLNSMLSGFSIDSFTNRNDRELSVIDLLSTDDEEKVCEESKTGDEEKGKEQMAAFSPTSVAELLQVKQTPPLSVVAVSEKAACPNKAEKRKDHDLSGSLHGKLLGSSKRAATSLSRTIHGSFPKTSLSKTVGLSKSLHGRILGRNLVGIDDSMSTHFSSYTAEFPLKSCLKNGGSREIEDSDFSSQGLMENALEEHTKNISFDVVDVREYAPCVSINPMVKDGLAVGLGWDYKETAGLSVDAFESQREPRVSTERDLVMDYVERLRILRTTEIPMKEIKRCIETSRKARNLRMQTVKEIKAEDRKCEALVKKLSKKSMNEIE